jgi:hypothetical protein
VLGYSNQYLLHEKLGLSPDERHRVMRAAAAAVEQDGRLQDWGKRLLEIQEALQRIQASMARGRDDERLGDARSGGDGGDERGAAEAAGG